MDTTSDTTSARGQMKELTLKLLRNNFTLWKEATYDELALSNEAEYIDFILTGVQWTQQEIMERDYLPTFGDGIELTAAENQRRGQQPPVSIGDGFLQWSSGPLKCRSGSAGPCWKPWLRTS